MNPKILPVVMIALQLAAAVVYAINRDTRHTVYWLSAAVLTASVTF